MVVPKYNIVKPFPVNLDIVMKPYNTESTTCKALAKMT